MNEGWSQNTAHKRVKETMKFFMRAYGLIFGLLVVSVLGTFARPVSKYELVSRREETRSLDQGTADQLTVKVRIDYLLVTFTD